jgi:mono/diheme cytochrome c family protein
MKRVVALGALLIVVAAGPVRAQNVSEQLKGAALAQQVCAECHAIHAGQPRSPAKRQRLKPWRKPLA